METQLPALPAYTSIGVCGQRPGQLGRVSAPSPEVQCLERKMFQFLVIWSLLLPSWLEAEV